MRDLARRLGIYSSYSGLESLHGGWSFNSAGEGIGLGDCGLIRALAELKIGGPGGGRGLIE